jgi:hypothetical protein
VDLDDSEDEKKARDFHIVSPKHACAVRSKPGKLPYFSFSAVAVFVVFFMARIPAYIL